ncbi:GAF domain-containing protein [Haloferula sargassicola]|uniref:Bacteriophytochrome n=1 Tax=Haloferula sargassicola TaxID=490096 RepID=A0ABP9UJS1_9BACT
MSTSLSPDPHQSCEQQAIHLIGQIQAGKALVALDLAAGRFTHGSAGTESITGSDFEKPPGSWLPVPRIAALLRRATAWRGRGPMPATIEPLHGPALQVWVYLAGPQLVIEWDTEQAMPSMTDEWDLEVKECLEEIEMLESLDEKLARVVSRIRGLTDFDRAMIYRFHEDGTGEVVAEDCREDWEPYLGLRYPAGDIPRPARELFLRNDLRLIGDVSARPLEIRGGDELDLSLSRYRQPAEVHIEYLTNMGVGASLVAAIRVDHKLWGLISCHHGTARALTMRDQSRVSALTSHLAVDLAGAAREQRLRDELACARLANKLVQCVTLTTDWAPVMMSISQEILRTMRSDTLVLHLDGRTYLSDPGLSAGRVETFIGQHAAERRNRVTSSHQLGEDFAGSDQLEPYAGVLWVSLSAFRNDCLLLLRREQRELVRWAGNPGQATVVKADGRIGPRHSFAEWSEQVRGRSRPWSEAERSMAETVRSTLIDIVITSQGFRELVETPTARRFRIAHQEVEHPLIFADPDGRVVYQNRAAKKDSIVGVVNLDELSLWKTDLEDLPRRLAGLHDQPEPLRFAFEARRFELARLCEDGEFLGYSLRVNPT